MSTYVISDIHGCYETFMKLINKIKFSKNDVLYILGDIIDRGPKSYEIFKWIKQQDNVFMILGNHEDMFIENINGLLKINGLSKMSSEEKTITVKEKLRTLKIYGYDHYGTLEKILSEYPADVLFEMNDFFTSIPLFYEIEVNNKIWTLVHASCKQNLDKMTKDDFLWDRDLTTIGYGIANKNIIFGHTPTITEYYNYEGGIQLEEGIYKNNKYTKINIDCGCVWGKKNSKLGILRLDDLKDFYQKNID